MHTDHGWRRSVSVSRDDALTSCIGKGGTRSLEFEKPLLFLATSSRGPWWNRRHSNKGTHRERIEGANMDPEGNNRGHECRSKTRSVSHKDTAASGASNRRLLPSSERRLIELAHVSQSFLPPDFVIHDFGPSRESQVQALRACHRGHNPPNGDFHSEYEKESRERAPGQSGAERERV